MNNNRYNNRNNNDPNRIKIDQDGLFVITIMISIAIIIGFVVMGIKLNQLGSKDGYLIFSDDFCDIAPPISFFVGTMVALCVFGLILVLSNLYEKIANKNRAKFLINSNIVLTVLYTIFVIIFLISYIIAIPSIFDKVNSLTFIDGFMGKIIRFIGIFIILPFYNLLGSLETDIQLLNFIFYLSIIFGIFTTLRVFCKGTVLNENDFRSYVEITYDADTGYVYNERYVSSGERATFWNCVIFIVLIAMFTFVPIIPLTVTYVIQVKNTVNIINTIRRIRSNIN